MWFFLFFTIFILGMIYLFYFYHPNEFQSEYFQNNGNGKYNLQRLTIPEYDIDQYILYNNDKNALPKVEQIHSSNELELYRTAGKWTLDEQNWYLVKKSTGEKIPIQNQYNQYTFKNSILEYGNGNGTDENGIAKLILDNHQAEPNIYYDASGKKYTFQDATKILAEIKVEKEKGNEILYNFSNTRDEYLEEILIAFIIITHLKKELEYSHDTSATV